MNIFFPPGDSTSIREKAVVTFYKDYSSFPAKATKGSFTDLHLGLPRIKAYENLKTLLKSEVSHSHVKSHSAQLMNQNHHLSAPDNV